MEINPEAGVRPYIGGCNGFFFSTSRGHRQCPDCISRREESSEPGIRVVRSHGE